IMVGSGLTACAAGQQSGPPAPVSSWAPRPKRHAGLSVIATSGPGGFQLSTAGGARTFLPGVNLGSTTPLHQPGELGLITRRDYRRWITAMGAMGIPVVRVYTLLPPAFYDELRRHNERHPDDPI